MDTINRIVEWSEDCEALNQYWFVGLFLAVAVIIVCLWKWLIRDIG